MSINRLLLLIFSAPLFFGLLSGCVAVPIEGQAVFGDRKEAVAGTKTVGQDFFSSDRNLNRIDVFLYPSRALKGKVSLAERRRVLSRLADKEIILKLYELPDKRLAAVTRRSVKQIRKADMYPFYLKPIPGSQRRSYYFTLSAPKLPEKMAVSVRLTNLDRYPGGKAYDRDRPLVKSDLRFLPYIEMTTRMVINSIGSRVLADKGFIGFWASAVLGVLVMTVLTWRRASAVKIQ